MKSITILTSMLCILLSCNKHKKENIVQDKFTNKGLDLVIDSSLRYNSKEFYEKWCIISIESIDKVKNNFNITNYDTLAFIDACKQTANEWYLHDIFKYDEYFRFPYKDTINFCRGEYLILEHHELIFETKFITQIFIKSGDYFLSFNYIELNNFPNWEPIEYRYSLEIKEQLIEFSKRNSYGNEVGSFFILSYIKDGKILCYPMLFLGLFDEQTLNNDILGKYRLSSTNLKIKMPKLSEGEK